MFTVMCLNQFFCFVLWFVCHWLLVVSSRLPEEYLTPLPWTIVHDHGLVPWMVVCGSWCFGDMHIQLCVSLFRSQ